jgi:hypothetical protein
MHGYIDYNICSCLGVGKLKLLTTVLKGQSHEIF